MALLPVTPPFLGCKGGGVAQEVLYQLLRGRGRGTISLLQALTFPCYHRSHDTKPLGYVDGKLGTSAGLESIFSLLPVARLIGFLLDTCN